MLAAETEIASKTAGSEPITAAPVDEIEQNNSLSTHHYVDGFGDKFDNVIIVDGLTKNEKGAEYADIIPGIFI